MMYSERLAAFPVSDYRQVSMKINLRYGFYSSAMSIYTQNISNCSKAARTGIPINIDKLCDWGDCSQPTWLQFEKRRV